MEEQSDLISDKLLVKFGFRSKLKKTRVLDLDYNFFPINRYMMISGFPTNTQDIFKITIRASSLYRGVKKSKALLLDYIKPRDFVNFYFVAGDHTNNYHNFVIFQDRNVWFELDDFEVLRHLTPDGIQRYVIDGRHKPTKDGKIFTPDMCENYYKELLDEVRKKSILSDIKLEGNDDIRNKLSPLFDDVMIKSRQGIEYITYMGIEENIFGDKPFSIPFMRTGDNVYTLFNPTNRNMLDLIPYDKWSLTDEQEVRYMRYNDELSSGKKSYMNIDLFYPFRYALSKEIYDLEMKLNSHIGKM